MIFLRQALLLLVLVFVCFVGVIFNCLFFGWIYSQITCSSFILPQQEVEALCQLLNVSAVGVSPGALWSQLG